MRVYFCDPHSPWQRGTNENTNGLLRQYFPKGTDLSKYPEDYLDAVAEELNDRPRKALGYMKPSEKILELLDTASEPRKPRQQHQKHQVLQPPLESTDSFAADGSHDITPSPLTLPFRHAALLKDATPISSRRSVRNDGRTAVPMNRRARSHARGRFHDRYGPGLSSVVF